MVDDTLCCDDGDRVERLTALVENPAGRLRIFECNRIRQSAPACKAVAP